MIKEWEENDGLGREDGKTLVDFYATWCGPCRVMSRIIEKYSEEVPELRIVKIDVDKNPELAEKFSVQSIPTLIFLDGENVKDRSVGVISESELREKAARLLTE